MFCLLPCLCTLHSSSPATSCSLWKVRVHYNAYTHTVTWDPNLRPLNLTLSKYISRRSNSTLPSRLQPLPHKIIMHVEYRPTFIMHMEVTQFPNQLEESTARQQSGLRVRTSSGSGTNTSTYISACTKTRRNRLLKTHDSCKLLACFPTYRLEAGIQSQCRPCDLDRGGGSITASLWEWYPLISNRTVWQKRRFNLLL
jgi:hypothetical protein